MASVFNTIILALSTLSVTVGASGCRDRAIPRASRVEPPRATSKTRTQEHRELVIADAGLVGLSLFGSQPISAELLRRTFPGFTVTLKDYRFYSAPDVPVPTFYIGLKGRDLLFVQTDTAGRPYWIVAFDAAVRGPKGLRVGATYDEAAAHLQDCKVSLGDEPGIVCRVRGDQSVQIWFFSNWFLRGLPRSASPTSEQLRGATIRRIEWERLGPAQPAYGDPIRPKSVLAAVGAKPVFKKDEAALRELLDRLAATSAPEAKPVGRALQGNFGQASKIWATVELQPGKCYTAIAVGLPGVREVDVLFAEAGGLRVLAQDDDNGPQAILGKQPECFMWKRSTAGLVRLVLRLRGSGGIAAAQIYEKQSP